MPIKAFCIHAHFYQPPREDPLSGSIPEEPGASPFKNWNERIFHDCYLPNIQLGNFRSINLNIGPTLVEWFTREHPDAWSRLVGQLHLPAGHEPSNIIAQPYHHTILPLATRLDKITQVRWGIASYEKSFGRKPEGMWLPETAVDKETLQVLFDHGIKFTILAPWQAELRNFDAREPYLVRLPQGKEVAVFFYDKELSTRVSFDSQSTRNADQFVEELLLGKFDSIHSNNDQLILIASDGELYGHHKQFREKFLAHLISTALPNHGIELTYPAQWLMKNPPNKYIKIKDRTSWSCEHGVERWKGPCACTSNGEWKARLRDALNAIAKEIDDIYFDFCEMIIRDPWEMRHDYIRVIQEQISLEEFLQDHGKMRIEAKVAEVISALLQSQVNRQKMFASCGWFFDDFERIEPQNAVRYAAQAVWLARNATGRDISSSASRKLAQVHSWKTGLKADVVFKNHLKRADEFRV